MAVGNNIGNTYSYKVGDKTYNIDPASQGGYMNAYNQYAADKEASKNLYEQQFNTNTDNLRKTLDSNNATTNSNYDNSARQAYVQYMQRQRALPSQLQALGVNGGATESGLLNLYNNYGSSHAANEQQRNTDLTANQQAYDDAYNNLVSERNQYLIDYNNDLALQKQTAINNQINEYNNEITRFQSSVAQYPTTQKGYEKYQKWIENMKKSNDPLKDIKVALIRQQMASQFPNGAPKAESSGSGGGGRRGGYSRRRGGGGGNQTTTADRANDAANNVASAMKYVAGRSMSRGGSARRRASSRLTRRVPSHGMMQ